MSRIMFITITITTIIICLQVAIVDLDTDNAICWWKHMMPSFILTFVFYTFACTSSQPLDVSMWVGVILLSETIGPNTI